MRKAELLAPAGNYEAFLGAVHAGADAVYMGGKKFGARAYADNLSEEELCRAVRYAHLYGRKLYLTLNTLVKEGELRELYGCLAPLYEAGLDGVIVQDLGVMSWLRRQFPLLALHVSTQAAVMGPYGAKLMKELGAARVVPSRELSLEEIRRIKEQADIEVETFIHGALCYCYSGRCLFSSVLGGRSGNRGRCAQPCRLPYQGREVYPLSLKDLCAAGHIPELIAAGIDSFKIEGRMKSAEYTAGVTAVYRKLIDCCYETPERFGKAAQEALAELSGLYVRREGQDGYYFKHNAKDMATLLKPGYTGISREAALEIRGRYLENGPKLPVYGEAALETGRPASFTVRRDGHEASACGSVVLKAQTSPLSAETVKKQLAKTGGTPFSFEELNVVSGEDCFLPVRALNDLRREALNGLEEKLSPGRPRVFENPSLLKYDEAEHTASRTSTEASGLCAEVLDEAQAQTVLEAGGLKRLYLPADLLLRRAEAFDNIIRLLRKKPCGEGPELYLSLPEIFRKRTMKYAGKILDYLSSPYVGGALIKNVEEYVWLKEAGFQKPVTADAGLYVWNRLSARFWEERGVMVTLPLELSGREWTALEREGCAAGAQKGRELIVYGRIPMMVSANCVRKTLTSCSGVKNGPDRKNDSFFDLTDRLRKHFPVYTNCLHCYNVIYNTLPLSLHPFAGQLKENGADWRLCFTVEGAEETENILRYFKALFQDGKNAACPPFKEYMKGYYKKGVE